jgi:hypothetical protein
MKNENEEIKSKSKSKLLAGPPLEGDISRCCEGDG